MSSSVSEHFTTLAKSLNIPATATIELLSPCNLKCGHCYVEHKKKGVLSLDVLALLFDALRELGAFSVCLTGGEIGLRKDLVEVITSARDRYLRVELLSSGTLWSEKEWDAFAQLGVAYVRLSVYSDQACEHDQVTQTEGSFDKTLASAKGLIERGIDVEFASPVTQINASKLGDVIAMGRRLNAKVHFDPNIFLDENGQSGPKQTLASFSQLVDMYRDPRVQPLTKAASGCKPVSGSNRPCAVGESAMFIKSDGEVYPCINWPTSGGNILNMDLGDIWRGKTFADARSFTNADLKTCQSCGDRGYCSPCAGMNLRERGGIAQPSLTICQSTRAISTAYQGFSKQDVKSEPIGHPELRLIS